MLRLTIESDLCFTGAYGRRSILFDGLVGATTRRWLGVGVGRAKFDLATALASPGVAYVAPNGNALVELVCGFCRDAASHERNHALPDYRRNWAR